MLEALLAGVCSKSDLIDEVWTRHGTVVTENSYYQLVSLLRKSFASIDLAGTVVTVPRKGLALSAQSGSIDAYVAGGPRSDALDAHLERAWQEPVDVIQPIEVGMAEDADCAPPLRNGIGASAYRLSRARRTGPYPSWKDVVRASNAIPSRPREPAPRTVVMYVSALITVTLAAVLVTVESQRAMSAASLGFTHEGQTHYVTSGDDRIRYASMPPETALQVWRDIQARVTIPPEQHAYVFVNQHRNRYAVLACSGRPDLPSTRCSTVTESL
ncbi:winged helix-turn-helix domain-containing protein [Pararobbsia silviterrae]|uniref:winged helix-turn-helix domain-containing protein n=1 Tax=Pararobbsia silviterrae TaxID=1792498 RepID=UPI0011C43554|nr:hypothetical protein [Pararobbsia silviterrae]